DFLSWRVADIVNPPRDKPVASGRDFLSWRVANIVKTPRGSPRHLFPTVSRVEIARYVSRSHNLAALGDFTHNRTHLIKLFFTRVQKFVPNNDQTAYFPKSEDFYQRENPNGPQIGGVAAIALSAIQIVYGG
ncbi:MAG TPA: hypothetical protein VFT44_01910, partial [Pyrinomonadaceae bacterium]|nr:hypothetical protein [Pyrinomonadaceae bacterium]